SGTTSGTTTGAPTATPTKTPTATPTTTTTTTTGSTNGSTSGGTTSGLPAFQAQGCASPSVGDKLTVCSEYDFNLIATKLIGLGTIKMNECANVTIQNNK